MKLVWRQRKSRQLIGAALVVLLLIIGVGLAWRGLAAQDEPAPAQGIQVSPVLIDLNADKGNSYNLKITVTNVTADTLILKQQVNDFKAKDESGNPEILLDNKDLDPSFSFTSWTKPAPNLTLKAKESREITVTVDVPNNAEAGGHYGVVRFSGTPPGQENANVSIAASVGVLVLTRVSGPITESLSLKDFYAAHGGKRIGLVETGPLEIVERISNDGNVHVKPKGTIIVTDMFGKTVQSTAMIDPPRNVLPHSIRRFSQQLNKRFMFGKYTAHLDASYGYGNKTLSGTMTFWVIPYRWIALLIILLIVVIWLLRRLIKRHNQKIVNKALANQAKQTSAKPQNATKHPSQTNPPANHHDRPKPPTRPLVQ